MSKKNNTSSQDGTKPEKHKKKLIIYSAAIIIAALIVVFFVFMHKSETVRESSSAGNDNYSAVQFTKHGELTFTSVDGGFISKIDIEIADDEQKRTDGLMFRSQMDENQGMLFIFPVEEYQSFWMRNTEISLDIIFINKKKEIVKIHKKTKTFSDQSYPSMKPSIYVVEVNGGYADRHGIKEGDHIVWRRI